MGMEPEMDDESCYAILGVDPSASTSQIRQAYRKLALAKHPDRGGDPEDFARVSKAYEVLSDSKARAKYDATGRTSKLSAEEEFIEAFRSSAAAHEEKPVRREEPPPPVFREAREEAPPKRFAWERSERQEVRPGQRRSGGVHSFSANVGTPGAAARPAPLAFMRPAEHLRADMASIEICGSWNFWRPQPMIMEVQRRCHKFQIQLNSSAAESFQLFVAGDGPGRCLHPDRPNAVAQEFHRLEGPDDNEKGYGWSIGKHPEDHACAGARYEVMLIFAANGRPDRLEWVRLNPKATSAPATAAPKKRPQPYGGLTMAGFLQAAKPDWSQKDITSVLERLGKITVTDLNSLLRALQSEGSAGINARFKSVSEKSFTDTTLKALKSHAVKVHSAEQERLKPKPAPAGPTDRGASAANAPVPMQEYKVIHDFVYLRQEPSLHAPILGKRPKGETFLASEETWDGWVKPHGQPGYVVKDMGGLQGIGKVLSMVGKALPVVLSEPQGTNEPLHFEVVYSPFVAVRTGPSKSRPIQGTRKCGERVKAVAQGYGGWVRVAPEEGGGWMLTADEELGQLLVCRTIEERWQQVAALRSAIDRREAAVLAEALTVARRSGVRGPDISEAERLLRELRQREAQRKELLQRAAAAQAEGREEKLRRCVEEAQHEDFAQEQQAMSEALSRLVTTKQEAEREHEQLLEALAVAARGGQVAEIKAARNAAKAGGVPMKEIARVFALHNGSAG
ncbi:unnamed protein product [Durusdinium trenchii]|uniref:J domain-containing protein n=1 Tax=Durusdinium trenchii TaxID=1381693 RepID=A0ABP0NPU2_9DINO